MKTTESSERARFVGAWRIVASTARFLPVAGLLHLDEGLGGRVSWPDAPHPGFPLFPNAEVIGERLRSSVNKPDPGGGGDVLRCTFSMALETEPERLLFGLVRVDVGRGDTSTGTFVAEEIDTDLP